MSANERNLVVQQTISAPADAVAADLGRTASKRPQIGGGCGRRCARCEANLGRFYNTGAACPRCRLRVCRSCRETAGDEEWLCSLCHKIRDLRTVSNEWRRTTGRDSNYLSALDILKHSIRRAWTINGPPARWSTARKSAEYRLYRSLPIVRRRDFLDEKNLKNVSKRTSAEPLIGKPPRAVKNGKPSDSPKKSSIPVFRSRNSREFEDLRSPHESPKRSLIPQRYRNSTDDLRRSSREDISLPSFIPKLLSPVRADKLKRQDSRDDVRKQESGKPPLGFRSFLKREEASCDSTSLGVNSGALSSDIEATRQECALPSQSAASPKAQPTMKMPHEPTGDKTKASDGGTRDELDKALQISRAAGDICANNKPDEEVSDSLAPENDKLRAADGVGKKTDDTPPVVKRKFSKEEYSNDDTDDTHNRRCSSHFSPEASPLSTRSSKYSPRESESEPTPALPRKLISDRGESSSASQRIRDAITRTRRESNSSAKYESSGSESVSRLGDSGLSSYVDIARRVKFFGSGSITGSCDEILQRDSATSAGEDEHDDHARDPMRLGPNSQRVMLRRRRQFDTQGPRRRGRSRACCGDDHHHLQGIHQVVDEDHQQGGLPALLDYRRLVFISSDSSSGREEDDADSSCSGSSYLNNLQSGCGAGLEDCDWDYFESNSLKLPQLQQHEQHRSLTCCPARPSTSGCCQTCGGSKNAKVLPVPVPIPVPVPYPVPVPASLWTGDMAGRASMMSRDAVTQSALSLRAAGCDPSTGWFTWNPKFDSTPNLLFPQGNFLPEEIPNSANDLIQQEKEEKTDSDLEPCKKAESEVQADKQAEDLLPDAPKPPQEEEEEEDDPDQKVQPRMFHQGQDSRSSSGRSSADSSDLEDSAASHRFSRVMIVNDDSLTSDNDVEDNEDSDSTRESRPATLNQNDLIPDNEQNDNSAGDSVVLKKIRHFEEDSYLIDNKPDKSESEVDRENNEQEKPQKQFTAQSEEIASYDEIYLASNQEDSENIVLLKSVKSIDPESYAQGNNNFIPGFRAFPKQPESKHQEVVLAGNACNSDENDDDDDDSSDDSAVMPDSLEVSMQDLEDSIEARCSTTGSPTSSSTLQQACDIGRALLAASSPVEVEEEGKSNNLQREVEEATSPIPTALARGEGDDGEEEEEEKQLTCTSSSTTSSSGALTSTSSSDELHEYSVSCTQAQEAAAYMAKTRKKWQIPASFDIKGLPSAHFLPSPPERKKDGSQSLSPLLSAAEDVKLRPDDEEEEDFGDVPVHVQGDDPCLQDEENANGYQEYAPRVRGLENERGRDESSSSYAATERVRGSNAGATTKQVGVNERLLQPRRTPTNSDAAPVVPEDYDDDEVPEEEEEDEEEMLQAPPGRRDWGNNLCSLSQLNNINNNTNGAAAAQLGNNKYRSLVMITQGAYQPVNVITSDTTTLMQPQLFTGSYYHRDVDPGQDPARRSLSQGLSKKPLPCKRLLPEPEVDSGLSVGSASESDDVSVKNAASKREQQQQQQQASRSPSLFANREDEAAQDYPSFDSTCQKRAGPLILEEGLADDDSWVEEISHDEDEASMTTATEESSEDEAANNLGDREEELRGYHRQAIDFTLHTIVEESCEESESEHASASWRRRLASASAPDLNRYLFFGVGADGNSSRELDSLSETSSIMSEGLDSLTREESSQNAGVTEISASEGSKRPDKSYFLSDFLGADQDRRDSDGSVGSDSEGRPSPEAQRRKRLVRARGTGRSHSSSLDNLLALTHNNSNSGSHQNSLQDISHPGTDGQESQSEGSSTETDAAEENQTSSAFSPDSQFDTVKRKKKKMRSLGAQSPRVSEDRNKTPEVPEEEADANVNSDEDGSKTPEPENVLSTSQAESVQSIQDELSTSSSSSKQQSRDSGFVGSCDDLLLQPQRNAGESRVTSEISSATLDARDTVQTKDCDQASDKDKSFGQTKPPSEEKNIHERILESHRLRERLATNTGGSLTRKDSFNNWSSDEETNLMMSKMRQFFKTMVANSNNVANQTGSTASSAASPAPSPSPRLSGYSSKTRSYVQPQNRTKPPQLVYFENELTRLMKTVPGIRDEQVREIVEYLSSEDTWSDSYDSSDYTSSDLEGATAGGRRSALQEQISASCQQIINKFEATNTAEDRILPDRRTLPAKQNPQQNMGRDTAFVYQKLVQSFTKMAGDNVTSDASSTPHSSPPLIAKVMHHIGSRLVALMHEVSESNSSGGHSHTSPGWRRYPHRTPSSASTTEDDDSTSDSATAPALPRSKSHDPLHLNGHTGAASMPPAESEERGEASDYERFSWRGSFESALMAADSRTKLSLLACSGGDVSSTTMAMAAKRRSAGDLLFNHKSFSREQLDRVRSCGSIGGAGGTGNVSVGGSAGGSIEEKIWSNRRRLSVPDANTRGESGASAGDEDTGDDSEDLEYGSHGDPRATTLPRGMNPTVSTSGTTNSLPRQTGSSTAAMLKTHAGHLFTQHNAVKSARYRPPGFTRNSPGSLAAAGPKRALSAPGLQLQSRSRRQMQANTSATSSNNLSNTSGSADEASLSEACSTPIIGASSRIANTSHASMDLDEIDRNLHLTTRVSLSSLGARSESMASVYSGAGEGRWGSVAVRGEVSFSLQYNYKELTLEVHVTECKDLAPVDVKRNRSDPYVKVYLLPDKSKSGKRKTKVKKHTLNPVFDETLKFHTSLNSLEARTLWLTVWHSDMFGRNDFLGEVRMPLENKIFDDPRPQWYPLQERTEPFDDPVAYKGEVIVGLKFVPPDPTRPDRERDTLSLTNKLKKSISKGSLHVLVKEARNLQTRAKNSGTCDPFCKSYLLPDKGRSGKQKTGVVRRSSGSPVWNHTFVYKDVSLQELAERGLELTVWDHDRIASNEFLGGVRFNLGTGKNYGKAVDWMDATGREMSLWQSMLERPNFWVEGAVTLRPNLHNHGKSGTS